jgi:putative NADH-flavin reductase
VSVVARKILVLGATGGTGQQVVAQALQRGHLVTAFCLSPERLTTRHDHLRAVTGSTTDESSAVADAVRGQDVVISALGVGRSFKPGGLITRSVPRILAAMEGEGVRRLIFISAFGIGPTRADAPLVPRLMFHLLLSEIYADKEAGEAVLRQSPLDWTIVYPARLTNGPRTGRYRVGEHLELRGMPSVSRADVADFLVQQAEGQTHVRRGVLVSY